MVDKIIAYEETPPDPTTNANYYTDTSLVCLFEDHAPPPKPNPAQGNGTEDNTFRIIEFAEAIRGHLDGAGYNTGRIYARTGIHAAGPERYEDGSDLPAGLTLSGDPAAGIPGFPWNGGTADINAAFAGGNFLVCFNGHGARDGWGLPGFTTADIAGLNNAGLTPVVFSFTCRSGWFDNSTDAVSNNTAPNVEAFCEEMLTHANGGAVAALGSSRNSNEHNDSMMLGAYMAIWPALDPNPSSTLPLPDMEIGPLPRMGQVLQFSKIYMANAYSHDSDPTTGFSYREAHFEMYHLFGDPEMPIWTEAPGDLTVSHPEGIGATGEQNFIVKVTDRASGDPVQSAAVTLTRRVSVGGNPLDRIIETALTGPFGLARFTLNGIGDGDIDVTITVLNFLPYTGTMKAAANGAIINRLEPADGPVGQAVSVGGANFDGAEAVDLYFDGTVVATTTASGGAFGLPGTDVTFTVSASQPLGPVNVMAVGQSSGRYAVDVFHVRTANPVDLWTYSQWDSSTWHPACRRQ
jgi:hypothetical protein